MKLQKKATAANSVEAYACMCINSSTCSCAGYTCHCNAAYLQNSNNTSLVSVARNETLMRNPVSSNMQYL